MTTVLGGGSDSDLFVAEGGRGPQGGCRPQAAQAPGLGCVGRLQGAPHQGAVRGPVGGGVRKGVIGRGHRHGPPLGMPGGGQWVRRELWGETSAGAMSQVSRATARTDNSNAEQDDMVMQGFTSEYY